MIRTVPRRWRDSNPRPLGYERRLFGSCNPLVSLQLREVWLRPRYNARLRLLEAQIRIGRYALETGGVSRLLRTLDQGFVRKDERVIHER